MSRSRETSPVLPSPIGGQLDVPCGSPRCEPRAHAEFGGVGRRVLYDEQRHVPSSGLAFLVWMDLPDLVTETIQDAFQESGRGRPSRRFFVFAILPLARVASVTGFSRDPTIGRARERSLGVVAGRRGTAGLAPPLIEVCSARLQDCVNGRTEPGVVVSNPVVRSDDQGSDEEASQPCQSPARGGRAAVMRDVTARWTRRDVISTSSRAQRSSHAAMSRPP
jgi:hypothetical protein